MIRRPLPDQHRRKEIGCHDRHLLQTRRLGQQEVGNQNSQGEQPPCRLPQPAGRGVREPAEEPGSGHGRAAQDHRIRCQFRAGIPPAGRRGGTRTAQGPLQGDQLHFHLPPVEDHPAQPQAVHRIPRDEGHRLFGHHRRVRRIVQGLSQEGAGTQERTREPLPVLAQPAHLHRRGPGSIACQPDRGRGIREERST